MANDLSDISDILDAKGDVSDVSDILGAPAAKPSAEVSQGAIDPYSAQYIPGFSQEQVNKMLSESGKGVISGLAQTATGVGELLPGEAGRTSARATQKLKEYGYGPSQILGAALVPGLGAAKAPIAAATLAGLAAPTGEQDTTERYKEKAINAAISGALVGLGSLTASGVQKFVGLLKDSKSAQEIDKLVSDLKEGRLQESLLPGRQVTPEESKALQAQLLTAPTHDQTGAEMLSDMQKNMGGLREERKKVGDQLYGAADQSMAAKHDAGDFWQESESGKAFIKDLESRLSTKEETTETASVRDQIRGLIRDLKGEPKPPPEVPILGPEGEKLPPSGPTVGYSRPSVVREVLRKLRDAASGHPEEGYAAIGQQRAGELADELSRSLAGWDQNLSIADKAYREKSKLLYPGQTRRGRAALAGEKFDINQLAADPASIPSKFFKTRQGVDQLVDLLGGNKALAEKYATNYVMRELAGVSPEKASEWLEKNRNWLFYDTLPRTYERAAKLAYQRESGALVEPFSNLITQIEKGSVTPENVPQQIRTLVASENVSKKAASKINDELDRIEAIQDKEEKARQLYSLLKKGLVIGGAATVGGPVVGKIAKFGMGLAGLGD